MSIQVNCTEKNFRLSASASARDGPLCLGFVPDASSARPVQRSSRPHAFERSSCVHRVRSSGKREQLTKPAKSVIGETRLHSHVLRGFPRRRSGPERKAATAV